MSDLSVLQRLPTLRRGDTIPAGLGTSTVRPSLDFETYSEAGYAFVPNPPPDGKRYKPPYKVVGIGPQGKGGLPVVGTPNYVAHKSAEVLSLYYDLKDGNGRIHWRPGMPPPQPLLDWVANGGEIEAFNITFEWWVWNMVCTRKYGWPQLPLEQCYCVMAKSRRFNLPGSLGNAAEVLGTRAKNADGMKLIRKLTRPTTPSKKRPGHRWTPQNAPDDFRDFYAYNEADVEAEDEVAALIPDLTPTERDTWLLDQIVNARGLNVDMPALQAALSVLAQAEEKYNAELKYLTCGAVATVSETEKLTGWLAECGLPMADLQKDTVKERLKVLRDPELCAERGWISNPALPSVTRTLEIRQMLGAANVKKLRTLAVQVSADGRLRDQYLYCGADRTGRASAGGVQLQNITAKGPKTNRCEAEECGKHFGAHLDTCPHCGCWITSPVPEWNVDCVEDALQDVLTRDLALVEARWGNAVALLCGCLRGLFIAKEGHEFVCVDFSAIEAVVAACLSRCQWRIDVFATHGKIYEASTSQATGIPLEEILAYKKEHGTHHPLRSTLGKVRELGGGFGGWINAWKNFGAAEFMTDEEIKEDVLKWRAESPEIVEMWGGQYREIAPWTWEPELYGLEGAAVNAIRHPGQCFSHIDITYGVFDDVLYCRLPSGRFLHYHRPRLVQSLDRMKRDEKTGVPYYKITFEGYNSNAAKGPVGWYRMETYGGRLFENCIAEGTPVLTDRGWVPIEHVTLNDKVHDGVEFVNHSGSLFKSEQACVNIDGVLMTPDHEVLTDDGWQTASQHPRPYRPKIRNAYCGTTRDERRQKAQVGLPLRLWRTVRESFRRREQGSKTRAHPKLRLLRRKAHIREANVARHECPPSLRGISLNGRPMSFANASSVGELRREGYKGLQAVVRELSEFLGRHGADIQTRAANRQTGQLEGVLAGELPLGESQTERTEQKNQPPHTDSVRRNDSRRSLREIRDWCYDFALSIGERVGARRYVQRAHLQTAKKVYDIINAGPRQRFVVRGDNGPFIVHNCVQAVAADLQFEALKRCERRGYWIVLHTHDEGNSEVPIGWGSVEEMEAIFSERPEWASWWPIKAAGWRHRRYQKD